VVVQSLDKASQPLVLGNKGSKGYLVGATDHILFVRNLGSMLRASLGF
jgi:hypothetical protein